MLIDVEVAVGADRQIERAVPRHEIEHVIEKADAGVIVEPPFAVEVERDANRRFRRRRARLPLSAQLLQRRDRLLGVLDDAGRDAEAVGQ